MLLRVLAVEHPKAGPVSALGAFAIGDVFDCANEDSALAHVEAGRCEFVDDEPVTPPVDFGVPVVTPRVLDRVDGPKTVEIETPVDAPESPGIAEAPKRREKRRKS